MAQTNDQKRISALEKKVTAMDSKIDQILKALATPKNEGDITSPNMPPLIIDIKSKETNLCFNANIIHINDDKIGTFTKLPVIYIKRDEGKIKVSLDNFDGAFEIKPQLISTYKNHLDDNFELKSVKGVAPTFNTFSFNKAKRFFKRYDGEHLNWKTYFTYELLVLFSTRGKEVLDMRQCENYNWSDERECGFKDTHDDFFAGVSQLFNAGYTMVDCDHTAEEQELYDLFLEFNDRADLKDRTSRYFLFIGDYGGCGKSPLLRAVRFVSFVSDWVGCGCARLCLPCEGVVKGSPLNEEEKE